MPKTIGKLRDCKYGSKSKNTKFFMFIKVLQVCDASVMNHYEYAFKLRSTWWILCVFRSMFKQFRFIMPCKKSEFIIYIRKKCNKLLSMFGHIGYVTK